ncbi:lipopolysaccharide assembly protein LapA domain-containing protein [Pseudomonas sp. CCOS 191]|uniref:lipopolysaccharide assembly protein LapA domain-containing protein n=1 Tax=Pseudomonas sp. CCOS 191 TaxID=1649877 RepID=UPI0018E6B88B|nr:lipopolysaccharide assembly protein LapA domain-containing protein [Pseudomonas sp. CCOS 191]MBI6954574.1 LapA family protein [Pseudomonas sp. CCOS 191]
MRSLKRALAVLFVLLLAAVVLFFVLENRQDVSLIMFGWVAPGIPVAVLVLATLLIGLVVGTLFGAYGSRRERHRVHPAASHNN